MNNSSAFQICVYATFEVTARRQLSEYVTRLVNPRFSGGIEDTLLSSVLRERLVSSIERCVRLLRAGVKVSDIARR